MIIWIKYKPFVVCSPNYPKLIQQYKNAGAEVFTIEYPQLKPRNLFQFPKSLTDIFRTANRITKIGKQVNADLIVTNTARTWLPGTIAAWQTSSKLIWFIRDYTYPCLLFKLLTKRADFITFVSQKLRNYYLGNKYRNVHKVIYVGTDMHKRIAELRDNAVKNVKKEFNIQGNNVVIGYIGRLVEWKGAAVLLRAIQKLKTQNPAMPAGGSKLKNIKVLVIGSGKGQEGDIENELRYFVKKHNLKDTVYLTGQRDDVPALLKIMDIFVHPSIEPEPFATTVVEAMQAGVAVIGNTIGGTPEIIENDKNGLLVSPNKPNKLAEAIARLVENKTFREKLAENGKQNAISGYTEEIITKQVQSLYQQVLFK